jgi:hypothetical protein
MDPSLFAAVELFNSGRYDAFQDALEGLVSTTRATSERQFYALLDNLAEALLQISDGDLKDGEVMLIAVVRGLDPFLPRYRWLDVAALREDCHRLLTELREEQERERPDWPPKLPRLRILPA